MRSRIAAAAVATIAAVLALAACSGDKSAGGGGGTLLVGMPSEPSSLFPLLVGDETGKAVTDVLFEKLAKIDDKTTTFGDAGFKPRLARSWDWAKDSMTIVFHLDPAARFHDGTPVLASDVAYTFRIAKDTLLGSPTTPLISTIDSVTVVDPAAVKVWFHHRSPTQFYDAVYQVAPVPEHVYGKVPVAEMRTSEVTRTPVGTGRFRFAKWEPGVRIEVIADTANAMGRAKLDRVVFMLSQAPTAAAASILAGQLDFFPAFPIDQVGAMDSGTVAHSLAYPFNGYGFLGLNTHDRKVPARPHPVLGDVAVRRAIAMGLDRRAMVTNIFKDGTTITEGPFPAGSVLTDTNMHAPAYDTTAARAALDAAGWRVGAKGVRAKNGRPLALEILVPTSSLPRLRYAELIQEQLNRLGFQVEVARTPPPQFSPHMAAGDYDMILLTLNTDPTVSGLQQFWSAAGLAAGSNFLHYQSPVVDAALDSAARATTAADTKRYIAKAYDRISSDIPAVWLYSAANIAAVHRRVEPAPLPHDGWWGNLADWTIPADKRIDRDRIGLAPAAR
jgi:peptide/nickel transport system substrate-binding protein